MNAANNVKQGRLTPEGYHPRLIENRLDALMKAFGCVEIVGPRWCGKTWTALSRANSITRLDRKPEREMAEIDPMLALYGETPHLVDEWQEVPEVWDAARSYVDDSGNERGILLLTGSSALSKTQKASIKHSGTGRIGRLHMRPLSLFESGNSTGKVSLQVLFNGMQIDKVRRDTSIEDIADWCSRGGWPANIDLDTGIAMETAKQYIQTTLEKNVRDEGKSPELALSIMRALAYNEGQNVTYKTLLKDIASFQGGSVVEETLAAYLQLFERLYITEELPGWAPSMRSKTRVRVKPKRYFVDPSLATALVQATPDKLLRDTQTLGLLFENLVVRDIRVYMSTYGSMDDNVFYYRDDKGLEVDLILEHDGAWAGVEIKLSDTKVDEAAATLLKMKQKLLRNKAARNAEPAFLAVVVGKGSVAYKRDDGVYVLPIATLAP